MPIVPAPKDVPSREADAQRRFIFWMTILTATLGLAAGDVGIFAVFLSFREYGLPVIAYNILLIAVLVFAVRRKLLVRTPQNTTNPPRE